MNANLKRVSLNAFLAGSMFTAAAQAADIKVMSDSPLQPALTKVVDLYRQRTHNQVGLVFDPSPAVKKRIEDGEAADVVIVQPDFAEALTKSGEVSAGDRPIIGHVGVGLGNRKDSPAYDISTVEKFKTLCLAQTSLSSTALNRERPLQESLRAWVSPGHSSPRSCARRPLEFSNLC
jgi:molybdate transport system substrate-binding protein